MNAYGRHCEVAIYEVHKSIFGRFLWRGKLRRPTRSVSLSSTTSRGEVCCKIRSTHINKIEVQRKERSRSETLAKSAREILEQWSNRASEQHKAHKPLVSLRRLAQEAKDSEELLFIMDTRICLSAFPAMYKQHQFVMWQKRSMLVFNTDLATRRSCR